MQSYAGSRGAFAFDLDFVGEWVAVEFRTDECVLGWFGPGGFVSEPDQRSYFKVNDTDLLDLEIELPSLDCQ